MRQAIVSGSFDNLRSPQVRLVDEAARLGPVHVWLWSDALVRQLTGADPKFPEQERQYLVESLRYVDRVTLGCGSAEGDSLPAEIAQAGATWVVDPAADSPAKREFCHRRGLDYLVASGEALARVPDDVPADATPSATGKRVIVTGCYDWFHSGHVRFFEEVSALGELYVVVGHDANIELLKGKGHPMFPAVERRYMAASIRFVHRALVSSGHGWLDAEPEIERIRPHIYAVNEDGDKPEKRQYCEAHGIEYRVLKRTPKQGLPARQSTHLRGF